MKSSAESKDTCDRGKIERPLRSTYAPAAMAMAIMMLAWGLVTHWSMSAVGFLLFSWALYSWMTEICEQWKIDDECER